MSRDELTQNPDRDVRTKLCRAKLSGYQGQGAIEKPLICGRRCGIYSKELA